MITTILNGVKFQKRARLSGYIAELGSAFLSADLDLAPQVREDHAAYIDGWLKVLKQDRRAIFTAASHAQRAADYLHKLQQAGAQACAA
ncbi:MAG: hypothetical protein J0H94_21005 [Rhizobiales bacterium]|nr:hypothetical protein [Hyphomicrobiales bacterium]